MVKVVEADANAGWNQFKSKAAQFPDGWTVQDFVKAQPKELRGTDSELTEAEVILLRLYTGYNPSHPRPHLP